MTRSPNSHSALNFAPHFLKNNETKTKTVIYNVISQSISKIAPISRISVQDKNATIPSTRNHPHSTVTKWAIPPCRVGFLCAPAKGDVLTKKTKPYPLQKSRTPTSLSALNFAPHFIKNRPKIGGVLLIMSGVTSCYSAGPFL